MTCPIRYMALLCWIRQDRSCGSVSSGAISAPSRSVRKLRAAWDHKRLIEITANTVLTDFTAAKILWVKRHETEIFAKCRHIVLPKDYLRYRLSGMFATDVSHASGM